MLLTYKVIIYFHNPIYSILDRTNMRVFLADNSTTKNSWVSTVHQVFADDFRTRKVTVFPCKRNSRTSLLFTYAANKV